VEDSLDQSREAHPSAGRIDIVTHGLPVLPVVEARAASEESDVLHLLAMRGVRPDVECRPP
jgi:hypothetical protein